MKISKKENNTNNDNTKQKPANRHADNFGSRIKFWKTPKGKPLYSADVATGQAILNLRFPAKCLSAILLGILLVVMSFFRVLCARQFCRSR
jgi:hypothetical protein